MRTAREAGPDSEMSAPRPEGSREASAGRLPVHSTLPVVFAIALATGFSGAVVPGSLLAVVVREALSRGWSAGPIMMIGHGLLELAAVILLVTGLIRFARAPRVQGAIGVLGAAVLLFLGYQTLLISGEAALPARAAGQAATGGWLWLVGLGAVMSMANPYWWLWWATIGAAHSQWAVRRGRAGVGTYFVGHILADVIWYSAVSIALGAGRTLFSPGVLRAVYVACAVFLLGLGVVFGAAGARALRRSARPAAS
jgi:threonine/homoserine/homoserine lactone efflux protein